MFSARKKGEFAFLQIRCRILSGCTWSELAMIDPQVDKLFPEEKRFEQITLTRAIPEGIYTLPPKQEIRPILESGGVWQK